MQVEMQVEVQVEVHVEVQVEVKVEVQVEVHVEIQVEVQVEVQVQEEAPPIPQSSISAFRLVLSVCISEVGGTCNRAIILVPVRA